jgi:hypothetical protein
MRTFMLIAMLVGLPMQAQAEIWDGNDLVERMREFRKVVVNRPEASLFDAGEYAGYVVAAHDAYRAEGIVCSSDNVTRGQIGAIVAGYLKAKAKRWNEPAIYLVREALVDRFPCR